MAKTSLKRMRTFIEMYDMQEEIKVDEYTGFPSDINYVVTVHGSDQNSTEYLCKTLHDASDCVNRIIYKLPIGDNATPYM
jgi:hypothetical protein